MEKQSGIKREFTVGKEPVHLLVGTTGCGLPDGQGRNDNSRQVIPVMAYCNHPRYSGTVPLPVRTDIPGWALPQMGIPQFFQVNYYIHLLTN